mmetsp:Transcript_11038/g.17740  ORF Transcript_11038/g.17740 Transcript_11038/m.17740 type:complete len:98 (-) Transcript_11038:739-1032(-)
MSGPTKKTSTPVEHVNLPLFSWSPHSRSVKINQDYICSHDGKSDPGTPSLVLRFNLAITGETFKHLDDLCKPPRAPQTEHRSLSNTVKSNLHCKDAS